MTIGQKIFFVIFLDLCLIRVSQPLYLKSRYWGVKNFSMSNIDFNILFVAQSHDFKLPFLRELLLPIAIALSENFLF